MAPTSSNLAVTGDVKIPSYKGPEPGVSKKEFEAFQKTMLEAITALAPKPEEKKKVVEATAEDNAVMPKQYQTIFEKHFDPKDGFTGRLTFPEISEDGKESGGLTFSIFVPDKFSNATDAWKQMHKKDIRVKALSASDLAGGISRYCELVSKNIQYNRNLMRK
ncbi:MAG: hypothetical protein DDT19_02902 [Syntrophomonadaceae bacterium]|nr:hypothetical protein [Bacillota bacterium]